MKKIAIFASGAGSNAEKIIQHLKESDKVEIAFILSNKEEAKVLQIAKNNNINAIYMNRDSFNNEQLLLALLNEHQVSHIILAGFRLLIPSFLVMQFPHRIINIHPSLLPKFGGKGMYGMNVHKAVIEAKEEFSGITIHELNQEYDKGKIIFQAQCPVEKEDTPESLASRIHTLEHKFFPSIIEEFVLNQEN